MAFKLFESILFTEAGEYFLLDSHLDRLQKSCRTFEFHFPTIEVGKALGDFRRERKGGSALKVRVVIARDGTFSVESERLAPIEHGPQKIVLSTHIVDSDDPFLYHKTTRRELYDREFETRCGETGCFDVIFRNSRSEITEGSRSNIFIKRDCEFLTPHISSGILNGVMRRHLLDSRHLRCREVSLKIEDLRSAERLFMTNSVRGIVEVEIDENSADR